MRDPRDPGGEYDRDAGFGVYCADERPWTSEDYVDYVMNHRVQREKSIHELVHEEITSRHVIGKVNHDRPFTKDTYEDNLQQAIEEAGDQMFYLIALRERMKEFFVEFERLKAKCLELKQDLDVALGEKEWAEACAELSGMSALMYRCEELERENKLLRGGVAEYATFEEDDA